METAPVKDIKDDFDPDRHKTRKEIFWRDNGFSVAVLAILGVAVVLYLLLGFDVLINLFMVVAALCSGKAIRFFLGL